MECPERLDHIVEKLKSENLLYDPVKVITTVEPAKREHIELVHSNEYIHKIENLKELNQGGSSKILDDTYFNDLT